MTCTLPGPGCIVETFDDGGVDKHSACLACCAVRSGFFRFVAQPATAALLPQRCFLFSVRQAVTPIGMASKAAEMSEAAAEAVDVDQVADRLQDMSASTSGSE